MNDEELLELLCNNFKENGNLELEWTKDPNKSNEAWMITNEEGVFIVAVYSAKVELTS